MSKNDNSNEVSAFELIASSTHTLLERSRCFGIIRAVGEMAARNAATAEEVMAMRAFTLTAMQMIANPSLDRRALFEPTLRPEHKADRSDMIVTALAEGLRHRRGEVLTDEVIAERARNLTCYVENVLCDYEHQEDEDTLPGVQVTVRDTASAPTGKN